jgi:lipid II:glycine glycyltransferase (peptidoglycan interpeptide bridge formation enzyme)
MVKWDFFQGSAKDWNKILYSLPFYSFYQSHEWGQIKSHDGWEIIRLIKNDSVSNQFSVAQILVKRLPLKVAFLWCPGGILGYEKTIEWSGLLKKMGIQFYYFRCSFHDPDISVEKLKKLGWSRPTFLINNNQSMRLDLRISKEERLKAMSSNWRHNLKRFDKKLLNVSRWEKPDYKVLYAHYQEFESMKGLARQHSEESIKGVIEKYGDNLVIIEARDNEGNLHSLRGCIVFGTNALDWYAITTGAGRSTYSSYGVLNKLIEYVQDQGVANYDLSGVDEVNNPGVYSFKKGAGGILVNYPGEYEVANFPALRSAMNLLMKKKLKV